MNQTEKAIERQTLSKVIRNTKEQTESDSAKEETQMKFSSFEELRKLNSDSSIISDYSSENSETVADSEVSSRKNFSSKSKLVKIIIYPI